MDTRATAPRKGHKSHFCAHARLLLWIKSIPQNVSFDFKSDDGEHMMSFTWQEPSSQSGVQPCSERALVSGF